MSEEAAAQDLQASPSGQEVPQEAVPLQEAARHGEEAAQEEAPAPPSTATSW